jgi:hypothetical protein
MFAKFKMDCRINGNDFLLTARSLHSLDRRRRKLTFASATPEKQAARFTGQACGGKKTVAARGWSRRLNPTIP